MFAHPTVTVKARYLQLCDVITPLPGSGYWMVGEIDTEDADAGYISVCIVGPLPTSMDCYEFITRDDQEFEAIR